MFFFLRLLVRFVHLVRLLSAHKLFAFHFNLNMCFKVLAN